MLATEEDAARFCAVLVITCGAVGIAGLCVKFHVFSRLLRLVWPGRKEPYGVRMTEVTLKPTTEKSVGEATAKLMVENSVLKGKLALAEAGARESKMLSAVNDKLKSREQQYEDWLHKGSEANEKLKLELAGAQKKLGQEKSAWGSRIIGLESSLNLVCGGSPRGTCTFLTLKEDIDFWRERVQKYLGDGKWDFNHRPPKPSVLLDIFARFEAELEKQKADASRTISMLKSVIVGLEEAKGKQPEDQIDKENRCTDPCSRPEEDMILRLWKKWADECLDGQWHKWSGPLPKIVSRICDIGIKRGLDKSVEE